MHWLTLLLLSFFLVACQISPQPRPETYTHKNCGAPTNSDIGMRLDVVRKLMQQGQLYAALAHLDSLEADDLQVQYLRAEALRQSRRYDEAEPVYQRLLGSCLNGEANHGLGLIAGRQGDIDKAEGLLEQAAKLLPIDPRIRNDFGYVLLLKGQYLLAQREFMTAIELDNDSLRAKSNLIVLYFLQNKNDRATNYAKKAGLDSALLSDLRQEAEQIKKQYHL